MKRFLFLFQKMPETNIVYVGTHGPPYS